MKLPLKPSDLQVASPVEHQMQRQEVTRSCRAWPFQGSTCGAESSRRGTLFKGSCDTDTDPAFEFYIGISHPETDLNALNPCSVARAWLCF